MEIAAALQREVDNSAQILSRERRLAPNTFTIDLSASDFDRLSTYGETLSRELASMLHEHAEEQHYMFAGPVSLNFTRVEDLTTGRFRVRSEASAGVTPVPGQSMTDTAISRAPVYLEINGTRHPLQAPGLTIGRGSQADLRIEDPGVSRRHIEVRVQSGPDAPVVTVVDLGSTNGTTVDGQRVQHARLGDGSVVQIGSTRIVVHLGGTAPGNLGNPALRPGRTTGGYAAPESPAAAPPQRPSGGWPQQPPPQQPPPQHVPPEQAQHQQPPSSRSRRDRQQQPPFKVADPHDRGPAQRPWSG
jgi:hypothetical protein